MTNQTNPVASAIETQFKTLAESKFDLESGNMKTAMADAGAKKSDLWQVPVDSIHELPNFNLRLDTPEYEDHVQMLFTSIMANGFYKHKPLTGIVVVEEGAQKIYLVDGHSRYKATKRAIANGRKDLDNLPVIIVKGTMEELLVQSFKSNNETRKYDMLETSLMCQRLRTMEPVGLETFQIGERLGLTTAYVESLLLLANADQEVRDMVRDKKVTASVALAAIKTKKDQATKALAAAVKKNEEKAAAAPRKVGQTAPAKVATVKLHDVAPEIKLRKEQERLAPRLFAEIFRMEKAGELTNISPELEKILFTITSLNAEDTAMTKPKDAA